jgi:putative transcriptional regulator
MTADSASIDLTHHFLIAMPTLEDSLFARSVVYLCEHSPQGAMGLVINKPTELNLAQLFAKLDLPLHREDLRDAPVLHGGPLQPERGFVLHEPMAIPVSEDEQAPLYASTLKVKSGLELTTSRDVLEALSGGGGPRQAMMTLGYASWGEGQLESELAENAWLTVQADPVTVFEVPLAQRYEHALGLLGLQSWMLSPEAGHA